MRVKAHHTGLTSLDKFSKLCTVNTLCFLNLQAQKVYQISIALFPLTPDIALFPTSFLSIFFKIMTFSTEWLHKRFFFKMVTSRLYHDTPG